MEGVFDFVNCIHISLYIPWKSPMTTKTLLCSNFIHLSKSLTSSFPVHPDVEQGNSVYLIWSLSGVLRDQHAFVLVHIYYKSTHGSLREDFAGES